MGTREQEPILSQCALTALHAAMGSLCQHKTVEWSYCGQLRTLHPHDRDGGYLVLNTNGRIASMQLVRCPASSSPSLQNESMNALVSNVLGRSQYLSKSRLYVVVQKDTDAAHADFTPTNFRSVSDPANNFQD